MAKQHNFIAFIGHPKNRRIPWPYCIKCGLVRSNGEANRKAATEPCPGSEEDK